MRVILMVAMTLYIGFGATAVQAAEMTIDEAYKALNHKRTQFSTNNARMSAEESQYLDHVFFVTDLAFRERMVMLSYVQAGKSAYYIDTYNEQIENLLSSFEMIKAPNKALKQIEGLILAAIREQQAFFNEWHEAKGTSYYTSLSKNYTSHKLVQASHHKLLQAYGLLKRKYSSEASHNQQSFYDHLCVLDFI